MKGTQESQRALLLRVARREMQARGFQAEFSREALAEVAQLAGPARADGALPDLRALPWCSIDNDDSRDLDQLTVAESLAQGAVRIRVAVSDVDAIVTPGAAVDDHAHANTTSVYTPPRVFPMLPERLSTDLTSLVQDDERIAMVVEMTLDAQGRMTGSQVVRARVLNRAKLAYSSVGAWLEGRGPMPAPIAPVAGLADNLRLQDQVAQMLMDTRHAHGALTLETLEPRAELEDDTVRSLAVEARNRAHQIIEDFMIASNTAIARFLEGRRFPVLRRVLRAPERWERIVDLAREHGGDLPPTPDAGALNAFLASRRAADPVRFPDLSLAVVKLLGRGEYAVSFPDQGVPSHFALAVTEYTHSTAPNRRYPDLITQRLLKAALAGAAVPYAPDQLTALATHCTLKESDAQKVERMMRKAAAACLLSGMIGREFDGIVTGASEKGTWVRILEPPVEGRVVHQAHGLDVGDRVRVRLVRADPERGFIDFERTGHTRVGDGRR
jgi:VacB/RNase II family 3'-5' exoribonuclease